jgi:UDP-N-acetylglucosamine diphosphorylase/glucosamine-1-phosphate N-acetyltransferase
VSKPPVIVFEDAGWRRLYPVTLSRPAFECRTGGATLGRRLAAQLAGAGYPRVDLLCRALLRPLVERAHPGHAVNHPPGGETVFVNGRLLLLGKSLETVLELLDKDAAVQIHGEPAVLKLSAGEAGGYYEDLQRALETGAAAPLPRTLAVTGPPEDARMVRYLWDLVSWNPAVLEDDFEWAKEHPKGDEPKMAPGAQILGKEHIMFREGVRLEPGSILDARPGPILLGEGVRIEHNAVVVGPASIGPHSTLKMGARIYGGVSLGPVTRIGGEVDASIVQGHANKQHDGFLGHAYLGAWTNLGAGTDNSDLKNNYSPVRVWTPDGEVNTELLLCGLFLGDHSKTAIGTRFNTGTVVGFSANVFGDGFPPRHVPSFSWGSEEGGAYRMDRALETARAVMARRKVEMEPADEVLFETIHRESGGFR